MQKHPKYCSAFNPDASETIAYNNPLFPAYAQYAVLSTYPNYSAISHWHRDLEFILVKQGNMTFNVNGELITLSPRTGILINSRQLHYGYSPDLTECEFICIILSPELLQVNDWFYQNYVQPVIENCACPYVYLAHENWHRAILEHLECLYHSFESAPVDNPPCFHVITTFLSIMNILSDHLSAQDRLPEKESSELAALRNMMTYVEEHMRERITLDHIARAGSCCKSRCSLLFKKYLRESPITYMTKLRLRKSLNTLLDSDASITDIAYAHGFCGASYYCETFQKYYGTSPLRYRNIQREVNDSIP